MDSQLEAQLRKRLKAKRKAKRAEKLKEEGGNLNLNSMMDMMTIILVFLLKSYGEEPISVTANTDLPFSTSEVKPVSTMTITISKKAIFVNTKEVVKLNEKLEVPLDQLNSGRDSAITAMSPILDEVVRERRETDKDADKDGIQATIIADADMPYMTLSQIIATSVASEVKRFRFLVYKGNMELSGTVQAKE